MSKKNIVPMAGGSVMPKVIGTLAALALLVVVVKHPGDAAAWVKHVVDLLGGAVDGVAAFFRQLAG